jgi:hypothetical protein
LKRVGTKLSSAGPPGKKVTGRSRLENTSRGERKFLEVVMKSMILKSFTMLMLTMALASLTVQAQSATEMRTNIPFRFIIGSQTLPAGEYTVRYVNRDSGKTALLFRSLDGRTNRIVNMATTQSGTSEMRASIVFSQYGDSYFLSEVWTGGDQYGLSLPKSRTERRLRDSDLSKLEVKRVTVALSARR